MRLVFLPSAIGAALCAAGVDKKDFVNPLIISSTLSPQDVAFYIHANLPLPDGEQVKYVAPIPEAIRVSLPNALTITYEEQINRAELLTAGKFLTEYSLNDNAPVHDFHHMELACELLDEQTLCFTDVPPGHETSCGTDLALFECVIQTIEPFFSFEELAKLPLFAAYLKLVQAAQA